MSFIDSLESLFPPELAEQKKGRLREGLSQFLGKESRPKIYTDFYATTSYEYFLQGDLVRELRFPLWDENERTYNKGYLDSIVISNTCDIDEANKRHIPKQVLLAKVIPLENFIEQLRRVDEANSEEIIRTLKNQEYSNLMYLPPTAEGTEYVAILDEITWISIDELNALKSDINENRIAALDFFGYYLFIFKLAYHLCRLPEETDR